MCLQRVQSSVQQTWPLRAESQVTKRSKNSTKLTFFGRPRCEGCNRDATTKRRSGLYKETRKLVKGRGGGMYGRDPFRDGLSGHTQQGRGYDSYAGTDKEEQKVCGEGGGMFGAV